MFQKLRSKFSRKEKQHIFISEGSEKLEQPVIIFGNQKSGTSAIAHLLADYGDLSKTIDVPPLWGKKGAEIIKGTIPFHQVVDLHQEYFDTDIIKEPMTTFFMGQVIDRFPKAKYLFIVRDPRDNIRSLLNRRKIPGHLDKLDSHHKSHLHVNSVLLNAQLWGGNNGNYITILANRWKKAISQYLRWKNKMILVQYESFNKDKNDIITDLATKLGIKKKGNIEDKLDIAYQPPGNNQASWEQFYGDNLTQINSICAPLMLEVGYPLQDENH